MTTLAVEEPDRETLGSGVFVATALLTAALAIDLSPFRFPELEPQRTLIFLSLALGGAMAVQRTPFHQRSVAERCVIAAFAWLMIGSVVSNDPVSTGLLSSALLGTLLLGMTLPEGRDRFWLLAAMAAGMTTMMAVAVALGSDDDGRLSGLSEEPNALAVTAALCLVSGTIVSSRWRAPGMVAAGSGALVLEATSAVLPALAGAIGVIVWVSRRWPSELRRLLAASCAAAAASAAVAIRVLPQEALPGNGYNLETINERTGIWSYLIDLSADAPVLGHGPLSPHELMSLGAFDERVHFGPTHAHNAVIELAVGGGWTAAVLFAIGIAAALTRAHRTGDNIGAALLATLAVLAATEPLVREPTVALLMLGVATHPLSPIGEGGLSEPARGDDNLAFSPPSCEAGGSS